MDELHVKSTNVSMSNEFIEKMNVPRHVCDSFGTDQDYSYLSISDDCITSTLNGNIVLNLSKLTVG